LIYYWFRRIFQRKACLSSVTDLDSAQVWCRQPRGHDSLHGLPGMTWGSRSPNGMTVITHEE
jgi:hypothetical protein